MLVAIQFALSCGEDPYFVENIPDIQKLFLHEANHYRNEVAKGGVKNLESAKKMPVLVIFSYVINIEHALKLISFIY